MEIEDRIDELLRAKHLRWADLSRMVGKTQSNLQSSVRGNPRLQILKEIAKALSVPVAEILPESSTSFKDGVLRVGNKTYALQPIEIPLAPYYEYQDAVRLGECVDSFIRRCWTEQGTFHSLCGVYMEQYPFAMVYEPMKGGILVTMNKSEKEDVAWVYQLDTIKGGEDVDAITASFVEDVLGDIKAALADDAVPEEQFD